MLSRGDGRRIVAFYEGAAPDDRGRYLRDILSFDDARIERVHDFIQWLFPLVERSGANPSAPRLDAETIAAFRARPDLRDALHRSLDRMLAFYGFTRTSDGFAPIADARTPWLSPGDHNHLRLTRMITSLRLLGAETQAQALFGVLQRIVDADRAARRRRVTETTYRYWQAAARDPLTMPRDQQ